MLNDHSLPRLIDLIPSPPFVVWDITYACPLRCVHCYSESGRRPPRHLNLEDLRNVTEAIIAAHPVGVVFSGGEPLLVRGLFDLAARMHQSGIAVTLYTSGWHMKPALARRLTRSFARVTVSLDGASAGTHDRIRGRQGSFERAIKTLQILDDEFSRVAGAGEPAPSLGIDMTVTRTNFGEMACLCSEIASGFRHLSDISCAAVIPTGLASRRSFADELLTEAQERALADGSKAAELRSAAPPHVYVRTGDNRNFQLRPDLIAAGADIPPIQIEPDGRVRAMPLYEGTVGSLLEEPLERLWEQAIERWSDPLVTEALRPATSMAGWAEATRRIDWHFGTEADRARIASRPIYRTI